LGRSLSSVVAAGGSNGSAMTTVVPAAQQAGVDGMLQHMEEEGLGLAHLEEQHVKNHPMQPGSLMTAMTMAVPGAAGATDTTCMGPPISASGMMATTGLPINMEVDLDMDMEMGMEMGLLAATSVMRSRPIPQEAALDLDIDLDIDWTGLLDAAGNVSGLGPGVADAVAGIGGPAGVAEAAAEVAGTGAAVAAMDCVYDRVVVVPPDRLFAEDEMTQSGPLFIETGGVLPVVVPGPDHPGRSGPQRQHQRQHRDHRYCPEQQQQQPEHHQRPAMDMMDSASDAWPTNFRRLPSDASTTHPPTSEAPVSDHMPSSLSRLAHVLFPFIPRLMRVKSTDRCVVGLCRRSQRSHHSATLRPDTFVVLQRSCPG